MLQPLKLNQVSYHNACGCVRNPLQHTTATVSTGKPIERSTVRVLTPPGSGNAGQSERQTITDSDFFAP